MFMIPLALIVTSIAGPHMLPLHDEDTFFRYEGYFSVYEPLGGLYDLDVNISWIDFKGSLLVTVEKNFVDYVVYGLVVEPYEEIPPELEMLIGVKTLVKVSRVGGNIYIDGQELPFLLVIDMDYISNENPVYNVSFDGLTNYTISNLRLVESEGGLILESNLSILSTIVPIGHGYPFSITSQGTAQIGVYSRYGYAVSYSYLIIPFFEKGLAIDFVGRLVDTNAEREPVDMVAALLEGYLRFLVFSLGPLGIAIYYGTMILAAGLVAAFVYWLVRRLR